ncbi:pseudouridine-5'-phosphate glycosidase [Candidatus Sumerlaeota bacterium]|nr:pseudouridine-5'-phosphate glycosidase [Candidatus Sumerlaeota bacterium]
MSRTRPPWLRLAPPVEEALQQGKPVVALESTVIAHGLPQPLNLEVAERLESIVAEEGAVPATVGILGGELHVGLSRSQIERLAEGRDVAKVGLSNLAGVIASGGDGATTVAGTMLACDLAGIEVFVTGGIGGVHPGAGESFDVSADLTALSELRVTVVSAGAKAILDIGATLQVLETRGVPVIGLGTDRFPAFYTPSSRWSVDHRVESIEEAAAVIRAHRANPHSAGLILANPIPAEAALPQALIDEAIAQAQAEAELRGIRGRALTPFLLGAVEIHSASRSLDANCALLESNARVGGHLAQVLSESDT